MNISLPDDLKHWVDQQVDACGFGTASEYMRDLLRKARERQTRRRIDTMLVEAVEGGAETEMTDADWASIRKSARTAAQKPKSRSKRVA